MDILDISDPATPKVIHRWRIEDNELHVGAGGKDIKIFKHGGRDYVILSFQFQQGGPDFDLGAIIFDVTDLPESFTEVARIQGPGELGGFHNIYAYKHSNGRPLLLSTVAGPYANVYDLGYVVEGRTDDALVAQVPVPASAAIPGSRGYHDFYAGYHADSEQDRFYGGGTGGYYVYNITDLENPELLVSLTGIRGVERGHTFTPSADGRYVIAETEYQYAPLRIFDLQPALDGEVANISQPVSAWTANWEHLVHNHEVRWPFVFVSGYLDGLQVFSMQDPKKPKTIAHYDTYLEGGDEGRRDETGAWGRGCAQRGRADRNLRHGDGVLGLQDAGLQRLERAGLGLSEHLECPGLGGRPGGAGPESALASEGHPLRPRRRAAASRAAALRRCVGTDHEEGLRHPSDSHAPLWRAWPPGFPCKLVPTCSSPARCWTGRRLPAAHGPRELRVSDSERPCAAFRVVALPRRRVLPCRGYPPCRVGRPATLGDGRKAER